MVVSSSISTPRIIPFCRALETKLQVNDEILVEKHGTGVIRFIGNTAFARGTWVGVELNTAVGKNNGTIKGKIYFRCNPKKGIFVRTKSIIKRPSVVTGTAKDRKRLDFPEGELPVYQWATATTPDTQWIEVSKTLLKWSKVYLSLLYDIEEICIKNQDSILVKKLLPIIFRGAIKYPSQQVDFYFKALQQIEKLCKSTPNKLKMNILTCLKKTRVGILEEIDDNSNGNTVQAANNKHVGPNNRKDWLLELHKLIAKRSKLGRWNSPISKAILAWKTEIVKLWMNPFGYLERFCALCLKECPTKFELYKHNMGMEHKKKVQIELQRRNNPLSKKVTFQVGYLGFSFKDNSLTNVLPNSQAERAGVKIGWNLITINGQPQINNHDKVCEALKAGSANGSKFITIQFQENTNNDNSRIYNSPSSLWRAKKEIGILLLNDVMATKQTIASRLQYKEFIGKNFLAPHFMRLVVALQSNAAKTSLKQTSQPFPTPSKPMLRSMPKNPAFISQSAANRVLKKPQQVALVNPRNRSRLANPDHSRRANRPMNKRQNYRQRAGSRRLEEMKRISGLKTSLKANNKGFSLLKKMGWKKGEGAGKKATGRSEPIPFDLRFHKGHGRGLGLGFGCMTNTDKHNMEKANNITGKLTTIGKAKTGPAKTFKASSIKEIIAKAVADKKKKGNDC